MLRDASDLQVNHLHHWYMSEASLAAANLVAHLLRVVPVLHGTRAAGTFSRKRPVLVAHQIGMQKGDIEMSSRGRGEEKRSCYSFASGYAFWNEFSN